MYYIVDAINHSLRRVFAKLALFALLCAFANVALSAGLCTNCLIKSIGVGPHYDNACGTGSCVFIALNGTVQGKPTCSTEGWDFVVDTSTDKGKKVLAVLLAAYAGGTAVTVAGNGGCSLRPESQVCRRTILYRKLRRKIRYTTPSNRASWINMVKFEIGI